VSHYFGVTLGDDREEVMERLRLLGVNLIDVRRSDQTVITQEAELDKLSKASKIVATDYAGIAVNLEFLEDSIEKSRVSYHVPTAVADAFLRGSSREEVFDGLRELFRTTDGLVIFDLDPIRESSYVDVSESSYVDSGLANYRLWTFNVYDESGSSHRVELEFSDRDGTLASIKIKGIPRP